MYVKSRFRSQVHQFHETRFLIQEIKYKYAEDLFKTDFLENYDSEFMTISVFINSFSKTVFNKQPKVKINSSALSRGQENASIWGSSVNFNVFHA
jgi:hypothetical protein